MTRARRKISALDGKRATVTVSRGGAEVVVHDVSAPQAFNVLYEMLETMQAMQEGFPEIRPLVHDHHGDYAPLSVFEDEWSEEGNPKSPKVHPPGDAPIVGFKS